MKGIILAAGYATRLYPLTKDQPKALLPVSGKPIIDYIVDEMNTIDAIDQIIVISNHRFIDPFQTWSTQRNQAQPTGRPIVVLDDRTHSDADKLGAVGDIQFCLDQLEVDDDILVIAGDNLFTNRLRDAWQVFQQHYQDMILVKEVPENEDPRRFAIISSDSDGLVTEMVEKPAHPTSRMAAYATYFYRRDTLPLIRQYLDDGNNPDAPGNFPVWLYSRKPVRAYMFDGICIDIGTRESYDEVKDSFQSVRDTRT